MAIVTMAEMSKYTAGMNALQLHEFCKDNGVYFDSSIQEHVQAKRPFEWMAAFFDSAGIPWMHYHSATKQKGEYWTVMEPQLCEDLQHLHHLHHINGRFINDCGVVSDEAVRQIISIRLKPFFDDGISRRAESILKLLRSLCDCPAPKPDPNKVYLLEGKTLTFDQDGNFCGSTDYDSLTLNRLPVKYDQAARCPTFDKYIMELLPAEDIVTLQEYMGYCLLPTTKVQKALFIKGFGGEGKSILTSVMMAIFGQSAVAGKLGDLDEATNRFKLATLENKLVFVDDDLQTSYLQQTETVKKIITAQFPIQAERKGKDAFEYLPYARILVACNTYPGALHDRSDGFYRRLTLLECLPVPGGRVKDRSLCEYIIANELPGILNWMIAGLQMLIRSGYELHESAATIKRMKDKQMEDDPVKTFIMDAGWVQFAPDHQVSTADLVKAFKLWCRANAVEPPAPRSVTIALKNAILAKGGKDTNKVNRQIKAVNGYTGVYLSEYAARQLRMTDFGGYGSTSSHKYG